MRQRAAHGGPSSSNNTANGTVSHAQWFCGGQLNPAASNHSEQGANTRTHNAG
jgi:hypothetical protein